MTQAEHQVRAGMSLRTKFAVLLGMFGLAVLGGAAAAAWSFNLLHREISAPFANVTSTLRGLGVIKREVEGQGAILLGPAAWEKRDRIDRGERRRVPGPAGWRTPGGGPPQPLADELGPSWWVGPSASGEVQGVRGLRSGREQPTPDKRREFAASARRCREVLDELSSTAGWRVRAGQGAAESLRGFLVRCESEAMQWFDAGGEDSRLAAGADAFAIHELIERMESRIVGDARLAVEYGDALRLRLLIVLGLTVGIAVLTGVLGQFLVRRWVLVPVARLRTAARRIGGGDFQHRVDASGSDEVGQLAGEVNHMASMIKAMQDERIDRERLAAVGEMVRRLAHNIRNPLSGIRGLAELTRSELDTGSDLRENQERIIDSVDRFERWLADLLKATRPADVQLETTQVKPWLKASVESHQSMAKAKGVQLVVSDDAAPTVARFDPRHLEHALVAIVANAIAATPAGGRVDVRAVGGDNGDWRVVVTDEGPGVAVELREKIFAPYFTTKRDGTGIGLAVALQVVRAHGGRILVDEAPSRPHNSTQAHGGARFTVQLPIEPALEGQTASTGGGTGATSGQNSGH